MDGILQDKEEPPVKKLRSDTSTLLESYINKLKMSENSLKIVMNDDISKEMPLVKVYTGIIIDVKEISKIVVLLNEKLCAKELQHLKRVKKREIVLCPIDYLDGQTIEEYLERIDEKFKAVFDSFEIRDVPKVPPKLKQQYEESKKYWPCNFHPDKYLERLFSDSFFSKEEDASHRRYMELVFVTSKWYCDKNSLDIIPNVTAVVDPTINSLVAVAIDNRSEHPMQHSAMLAIDNVARTQNGGAWTCNKNLDNETLIDLELLTFLKEKFPEIKFGHRPFRSKRDASFLESNVIEQDGPYLCTGYYIYILREPCLMCSMALVHARAKRIFFSLENTEDGALKSKAKLQTVPSLNHHFEVFTGFL